MRTPETDASTIEEEGGALLVTTVDADTAPEPDVPGDDDAMPLALTILGDADGEPLCDRLRSGLPVIDTDPVPLTVPPPETVGEFVIDDDPDTEIVAPRLALELGVVPRDTEAPVDADLRALAESWGLPLGVCEPRADAVAFADTVASNVESELALVVNDARATVAEVLCEADTEDCVVAEATLDGDTELDPDGSVDTLDEPLPLGLPDARALADDDADTQREPNDDGVIEGDGEFTVETVCVAVVRGVCDNVALPLFVEEDDAVAANEALAHEDKVTTGVTELSAVVD